MARNLLTLDKKVKNFLYGREFIFQDHKKTAWIFSLAVFLFLADRGFKWLALDDYSREILGKWLGFNFVRNFGIAFSLPLGGIALNWLILVIIIVMGYFAMKALNKHRSGLFVAIFGILLGSISNLIDRVYLGYVVDYLDLRYFTVFNLADVLIVGSIGWILIRGIDKK